MTNTIAWNQELTIKGVRFRVEPVRGMLVRNNHIGEWGLTHTTECNHVIAPVLGLGAVIRTEQGDCLTDKCSPILPAVPGGLTCQDVFEHCCNKEVEYVGWVVELEAGAILFENGKPAYLSFAGECAMSPEDRPADKRDREKYDAVIEWWRANTRGHDGARQ